MYLFHNIYLLSDILKSQLDGISEKESNLSCGRATLTAICGRRFSTLPPGGVEYIERRVRGRNVCWRESRQRGEGG